MTTAAVQLPLWVEAIVALLAVAGSVAALIGSLGLVRLGSFFDRIHAPTLGATLGTWGLTIATAVYFSFQGGTVYLHAFLISAFVIVSAPITTIFLMRAALFRERLAGRAVPPTVSR